MTVPCIRLATMVAAAWLVSSPPAQAQAQTPAAFTVISPVFGQLVSFAMPSNFVAGYEKTNGPNYTREAVPKGETVGAWTQMITVTGARDGATPANASAENFAGSIAGGFKRACPETFAAKAMGATKVSGFEAFIAVVGCGRVSEGGSARSETALLVAIKGAADIYTVQWAERSAATGKADVDNAKWQDRLRQLAPIRLCAIVSGEKAPYPSCVGKP